MGAGRGRTASAVTLIFLLALLSGCAGTAGSVAAGSAPAPTAPTTPTPSPQATSSKPPETSPATPGTPSTTPDLSPPWQVGASPLPLRPDGFGYVLPTPPQLVNRRLPTVDVLPPPPNGVFTATIDPISTAIRRRMGETWSPNCPVSLAELRYVTVSFRGFDAKPHTGELVINRSYAQDIVSVFRKLYAARFPIEEMRLVTTADLDAPPTGDGNTTSAYVCRAARGQTRWSEHAYGRAIDVNPFQNPYVKDDLVLPELASAYVDRSDKRAGMIFSGGVVVNAFAAIGWGWGGNWQHSKDYQHFSSTGT
jgi:hypothetical protein